MAGGENKKRKKNALKRRGCFCAMCGCVFGRLSSLLMERGASCMSVCVHQGLRGRRLVSAPGASGKANTPPPKFIKRFAPLKKTVCHCTFHVHKEARTEVRPLVKGRAQTHTHTHATLSRRPFCPSAQKLKKEERFFH